VSSYGLFGTFSDPTRIVSYPDGNVYRVASFVFSVAVASFDGLRTSAASISSAPGWQPRRSPPSLRRRPTPEKLNVGAAAGRNLGAGLTQLPVYRMA
jgi:hypothetical protein